MGVVAEVRRDVGQVARGRDRRQVGGEPREVDVVGRAGRGVRDAVEVHERVVPRGVLVADLRPLGVVRRVGVGVPTRRAHVLHVAAPGQALRLELVGDGLHTRGVDAPVAYGLLRRDGPGLDEVRVDLAVTLRLRVRPLAADLGDVVGQAVVRGAVVLREQLTLRGQGLGEVRRGRVRPEGLVVALVLEVHHEHVPHGRRLGRRSGLGGRRGRRGSEHTGDGEPGRGQDGEDGAAPDASARCSWHGRSSSCGSWTSRTLPPFHNEATAAG